MSAKRVWGETDHVGTPALRPFRQGPLAGGAPLLLAR